MVTVYFSAMGVLYICMHVCVFVESSGEDSQVAAEVDNLTAVTLEVRVFCSSVVLLVACSYGGVGGGGGGGGVH